MNGQRGWTLVELSIVMLILGILAAVGLNQYVDLKRKATESALRGELASLRGAVAIYYSDMEGQYPTDLNIAFAPGSKYINGIPSGTIPDVSDHDNPGHETAQAAVQPYDGVPAQEADFQSEGSLLWGYVNEGTSTSYGRVFANCRHRDTAGEYWTNR